MSGRVLSFSSSCRAPRHVAIMLRAYPDALLPFSATARLPASNRPARWSGRAHRRPSLCVYDADARDGTCAHGEAIPQSWRGREHPRSSNAHRTAMPRTLSSSRPRDARDVQNARVPPGRRLGLLPSRRDDGRRGVRCDARRPRPRLHDHPPTGEPRHRGMGRQEQTRRRARGRGPRSQVGRRGGGGRAPPLASVHPSGQPGPHHRCGGAGGQSGRGKLRGAGRRNLADHDGAGGHHDRERHSVQEARGNVGHRRSHAALQFALPQSLPSAGSQAFEAVWIRRLAAVPRP